MHSFSIPGPYDMALRIALALISSAAIGFDRGVHGHIAGLRTTMLVGLAAAVAMVLADTLLGVDGKTASSFSTLDPMRLPLGVLTGVGFIGGGAILRRGDLITGVTTAATLWMVTVIGLCFGAGQIGLGLGSALTALLTLRAMKWVEVKIPRDCRAMLEIAADLPPSVDEVAA
jgi:putative Mg2+ transporter-C (MgtC) family protein